MPPTEPERVKTPPLNSPRKRKCDEIDQKASVKLSAAEIRRKQYKERKSRRRYAQREQAKREYRMAHYNNSCGIKTFHVDSESEYEYDSDVVSDASYSSSDAESDSRTVQTSITNAPSSLRSSYINQKFPPVTAKKDGGYIKPDLSQTPTAEGMGTNRLKHGFYPREHKGDKVCKRIIDGLRSEKENWQGEKQEFVNRTGSLERRLEAAVQEIKALKKRLNQSDRRIRELEG